MEHISIEGLDGSGKTTIARYIAQLHNYQYVPRALHRMRDTSTVGNGFIPLKFVMPTVFSKSRYGVSEDLYNQTKDKIVTDRYIISCYWKSILFDNVKEEELNLQNKTILQLFGIPRYTILLTASYNTLVERLKRRGTYEQDIEEMLQYTEAIKLIDKVCERLPIPIVRVNTDEKTIMDVANEVSFIIENGSRE